jgi:hypothetical protein
MCKYWERNDKSLWRKVKKSAHLHTKHEIWVGNSPSSAHLSVQSKPAVIEREKREWNNERERERQTSKE